MPDPRDQMPEDEPNLEQREPDQAQDVANDSLYGAPGDDADDDVLGSTKPRGGLDDDNDLVDTVDQLKQMLTSGRIDMSAYAGEPMMDDGDTVISDLDSPDGMEGRGDDDIGGHPDDTGRLDNIADTGDDPLAAMSSDHGDDDETEDDDALTEDVDEDDLPGGIVLNEERIDIMREIDDGEDETGEDGGR